MADRFWVGNGGNWADDTNHWSTVSNGSPGAGNKPTSTDNANFDQYSFTLTGQTVTLTVSQGVGKIITTGMLNSPKLYDNTSNVRLYVYDSVDFTGFDMSGWRYDTNLILNGSGTYTLKPPANGIMPPFLCSSTGSWTFLGNYNCSPQNATTSSSGIIHLNGYTFTCATFWLDQEQRIALEGGVINCTWWRNTTDAGVSDFSTGSIISSGDFTGNGKTYNDVTLTGGGTIANSNTFGTLTFTSGATMTVYFADGTTQHITTPVWSGVASHIHTLRGSSTGGWAIVKDGGGTINLDYLSVTYSTASGGTWNAGAHSTDAGHNSGWSFGGVVPAWHSIGSGIATGIL